MKNKLIIVGNTANARVAHFLFEKDTHYEVCAFVVNKEYLTVRSLWGKPVVELESIKFTHPPDEYDAFVAIGYSEMNQLRERIYFQMKELGYTLPNYISPRCTFLSDEPIGDNNFILEDNTIQPFVKIGSNNVLWSGNHIGHEAVISDHCYITSHVVVSGFTVIERNCFLGVNSTIRDNIRIAPFTLIGAGAIIMNDTEEEAVYLPARSVKIDKKSTDIKIS